MTALKKCLCLVLAVLTLAPFSVLAAGTGTPATGTPALTQTATSPADETLPAETASGEPIKFSDVDYDSTLGKTIEKLVDKGVISGFPDGTFKSSQTLTRAEFSKIIVTFASADTAVNLDSGFPDVDNVGAEAHWAKPYIKVAKDLKIIAGFPDGTFHPDEAVTYEQAVKMIMCSLNYTDYTYPDGFMQIALQKKLLTGSTHKGENSAPITRESTVILVNNAYDITPNKTNGSLVDIASGGTGGSSGSSKGHGGGGGGGGGGGSSSVYSRKIYGVVWGNQYTMLDYSENKIDSNEIAIKYTDSKTKEEKTETLRLADKYVKSSANYLGKNVQATVKENEDGKEYIDELKVIANKNYSLSINTDDFVSLKYDNAEGRYVMEYISGNDYKTQDFNKDSDNIYVIYNGKSICMTKPEDYKFDPAYITGASNGYIRILSNDSDKYGDVVIINDYKTGVINSKNATTKLIKFKNGDGELDASEKGREVSIVGSRGGYSVEFEKLKSFDVLDYASSLDGSVLSVIVSPASETANVITGTVTKFTEEDITVKASGASKATEYELNDNYINYYKNYEEENKYYPQREDRVKLHLNSFGKVAAIEQVTTNTDERYGYIADLGYASGKQTPEEEDSVRVKIHEVSKTGTSSNGIKIMEIAKNVRVDGVLIKDDPAAVAEVLKKAATVANEGKTERNSGTAYASFVRYEVEANRISLIDTLLDDKGQLSTESDERYNTLIRSRFVYNENDELSGRYKFYSTTPYGFYKSKVADRFKVRANSTSTLWLFIPGNRKSEKNYKSGKFTTANFHSGMEYYVEAYNVDSQNYAQFVLQYVTNGKEDVSAYSTQALITGIETEGESESGRNKLTYRIYSATQANSKAVAESSPADRKFDSINIGDVILFSEDSSGEIYDFYKALDIENLPVGRVDKEELLYSTSDINDRRIKSFDYYPHGDQRITSKTTRYRTFYGTATEYKSPYLSVNPYLGTDFVSDSADKLTESFQITSSTKLFVYDESLSASRPEQRIKAYTTSSTIKKFLEGDDDDGFGFTTAKTNGGEYVGADQVFVYTYSSNNSDVTVRFIYVIRRPSKQSNPDNYPGVTTPEEDPLKGERKAALTALKTYKDADNYTGTANKAAYTEALASGIDAIEKAETAEAITSELEKAKAVLDEIIPDGAADEAKSEIESYVSAEEYPSVRSELETIIEETKSKISAATKNSEIGTALRAGKAAIDEKTAPLLEECRTGAKAEIDAYLQDNSGKFTEDEELTLYIEGVKAAIDECRAPSVIKAKVSEAKAEVDRRIAQKELAEAKTAATAEVDAYAGEHAGAYADDADFTALMAEAKAAINSAEDTASVEGAKTAAIAKIDEFVASKA